MSDEEFKKEQLEATFRLLEKWEYDFTPKQEETKDKIQIIVWHKEKLEKFFYNQWFFD